MAKSRIPQRWIEKENYAFTYIVQMNGNRHKVLVSIIDVSFVSKYRWFCCGVGYAWTYQATTDGKMESMHRLLLMPTTSKQVDHINHNRLDNRRENIRICTASENSKISKPRKSALPFKGIARHKGLRKPFFAGIKHNGKSIAIGYFETAKDAAIAYDEKAKELHGDFALTNKMLGLL